MAIGWLALLKSVPWTEVVSSAPKIADGARRLWNAVGKKSSPADKATAAAATLPADAQAVAALESRIAHVEGVAADLHQQMLASSELIKALADQNSRLIESVGNLRQRVIWLAAALAVAIAAGVVFALMR
jgi:hypothetical protein